MEQVEGGGARPVDGRRHEVDLLASLASGPPLDPLPAHPGIDASVPHAPRRPIALRGAELKLALRNALRYFPTRLHATLAPEFATELREMGHIYMHRLRPTHYAMRAYPIDRYPAKCQQAAAVMLMVMNNLDPAVAQFPHELVTYGGNGSVFSNWAQFHLVMQYLSQMGEDQTLVLYSGHPLGLFPSSPAAPRVVVTNGLMVANYSTRALYEQFYAQGVTQYGQMTAGSFCYIGPQGIVHGTTLTLLNASRKYLGPARGMKGVVFVSSGLGGMSGAQPKAATITGCVGVVAEVDGTALRKRHAQGWVQEVVGDGSTSPASARACVSAICAAKRAGKPLSIGFHGNVVALWEALAAHARETGEVLVELGSDQTSCHNPYMGGYYPVQLSFEEARTMMSAEPERFRRSVTDSLVRHAAAIGELVANHGLHFWDYGNSFLLECGRANADVFENDGGDGGVASVDRPFRYPSYVQDIMGDIFSLGFGPFRWVCTSGEPADLAVTDAIAARVFEALLDARPPPDARVAGQLHDNLRWILEAGTNQMVVGSQSRILYSNRRGRAALATGFNDAVRDGRLSAPVVISRDHHDVSGTDSPFRETANITDGSKFTADMSTQNVIGDAFRGATWVALHNGGGTGWGEASNGGFGLVMDGTPDAAARAESLLLWDVNNGVARRAWGGNENAQLTIREEMELNQQLRVTMPHDASDACIDDAMKTRGSRL